MRRFFPAPDRSWATKATFELVTPAVLGRLDRHGTPALAGPPVKAALRWWWRALRWPAIAPPAPADEAAVQSALARLATEEARLFGKAAADGVEASDGGPLGQAPFTLSVRWTGPARGHWSGLPSLMHTSDGRTLRGGAAYLGYGLLESGKVGEANHQPARNALAAGQQFTVEIRPRPGRLDGGLPAGADFESLIRALGVFGLLGGLGARARRGFGSVRLIAAEGEHAALLQRFVVAKRDDYAARLHEALGIADGMGGEDADLPPYTAVSPHARVAVRSPSHALAAHAGFGDGAGIASGIDALEALGVALLLYRSNGFYVPRANGHVVSLKAPQGSHANFDTAPQGMFEDERAFLDQVAASRPNTSRAQVPSSMAMRRQAFGLPLTMRTQSPREREFTFEGRRASPLLMHVHRFADGYAYGLLALPATFYFRDTIPVSLKKPKDQSDIQHCIHDAADFRAIFDFFDARDHHGAGMPYFEQHP
jgi:CRISPR-associated protein Cmr1